MNSFMLSFVILSLLSGVGISIITSILGNFMLWKRVSYLGDAIGHSSILGIAIGVLCNDISMFWVFVVCIIFAIILVGLKQIYTFTFESLIVFNVQLFLSLGLVMLGWFYMSDGTTKISYLFGDLFLLTTADTIYISMLASIVVAYVIFFWKSLLLITINEDLAYSENIKVVLNEVIFMVLLSASIAFLVKFIGVFLIPSLLIIPALISNYICKTATKCFIISAVCSYIAILCGVTFSFFIDIPVTPLITLAISIMFIIVITSKYYIKMLFNKE